MSNIVKIGKIEVGENKPLVLIAGTCVIENEESCIWHAKRLKQIADLCQMPLIFKASYDKANKTIKGAYRGPGIKEGLRILKRIKDELSVPILTDVHSSQEVEDVARVADILQIPALLSKQIDLVLDAAKTQKVINLKKSQCASPWDLIRVIEKIEDLGNRNIFITERGSAFGYNTIVNDFRSFTVLKEFGYPVIYDASHSVSAPSEFGIKIGGNRKFIYKLSLGAVACGANGLFVEIHKDPEKALSDPDGSYQIEELPPLLEKSKRIHNILYEE